MFNYCGDVTCSLRQVSFVFLQTNPKCPFRLTDVHGLTIFTRDLINHTAFMLWFGLVFGGHQDVSKGVDWFEMDCDPLFVQNAAEGFRSSSDVRKGHVQAMMGGGVRVSLSLGVLG